jgi:hypothetical protein
MFPASKVGAVNVVNCWKLGPVRQCRRRQTVHAMRIEFGLNLGLRTVSYVSSHCQCDYNAQQALSPHSRLTIDHGGLSALCDVLPLRKPKSAKCHKENMIRR